LCPRKTIFKHLTHDRTILPSKAPIQNYFYEQDKRTNYTFEKRQNLKYIRKNLKYLNRINRLNMLSLRGMKRISKLSDTFHTMLFILSQLMDERGFVRGYPVFDFLLTEGSDLRPKFRERLQ